MNRKMFLCFALTTCALFGLLSLLSSAVQTQTSAKAQIVFTSNADIYVMDADGKNHRRLTDGLGSNTRPAWTPDGRQIAFDSFRDGNSEIYVMDSDGKNPQNLTRHSAFDSMPSWSPDGQKLAFVSDRDAPAGSGHQNIYVMNADGKNVRRLTNYDRHLVYRPVWSPNGQKIAFALFGTGPGEPERAIFDIFVMDADGKNLQNLTNNPRPDSWPAWSPDGQKIAFVSDRDGNSEIYIMDSDGKNPQNLTNHPAYDGDIKLADGSFGWPAWSSDSSEIIFPSWRDGNAEIYVMNAAGRNVRRLTNNPGANDLMPDWFDPTVARPVSVSPAGKLRTIWSWLKRNSK